MKKTVVTVGVISTLVLASATIWACSSWSQEKGSVDVKLDESEQSGTSYAGAVESRLSESKAEDMAVERWVDSIMARLSTRERIAQLFVPRLDIENNPSGIKQLQQVIGRDKMGGFLLGKGTVESYAALINEGQRLADVPLMITLDGEWGLSMRVGGTPRFPHNIALGAADNPELMEDYGREMARQCWLMGIQVNFAPVMDVNSNPRNPVIGDRSFGESPELVGRLASAYSRGMASEGVMPVGKHFPGHGDTSADSHKTLPLVDHSIKTLNEVDLLPFKMAIHDGLPGVMVGHLKVPAMDSTGAPSSLSKTITTDWLRDSLGFRGLVFTDALAMKGASRANENNCVSALLAGADILLGSGSPSADLNAVESAVESGKIRKDEIDRKCRKILKYKYLLGLYRVERIEVEGLSAKLNTPEADRLISMMSQQAITLLRNNDRLLPLSNNKIAIVNIGAKSDNLFAKECSKYSDRIESVSLNNGDISQSVRNVIAGADVVVFAVYKDSSWARNLVARLVTETPSIGVFFINPFKMINFNGLDRLQGLMLAYDNIPQLQTSAADALFGNIKIVGKLPVNLPGIGEISDGLTY